MHSCPVLRGTTVLQYFKACVCCGLQVTVHTGDAWGAGTDAHVFVDIRGSNGSSGTQELSRSVNGSGNCFERGQADSFQLRLRDLGELAELTVWHDNSGMAAGWNLAYIEMQHVGNGQVRPVLG